MAAHTQDGPSPLMHAISFGQTGVIKMLLRFGADCNYSSIVSSQLVCLPWWEVCLGEGVIVRM